MSQPTLAPTALEIEQWAEAERCGVSAGASVGWFIKYNGGGRSDEQHFDARRMATVCFALYLGF